MDPGNDRPTKRVKLGERSSDLETAMIAHPQVGEDLVSLWPPLDTSRAQVRLLTLLAAEDEDAEICCELNTVDIESSEIVEFEALSYVWGNASQKHCIKVNNRAYEVWNNLHTALHYLRHGTEHRALWIDAICINQIDVKEKRHQILQIHSVFHRASQVVIWLGEPDEEIDSAMDVLEDLERRWDETLSSATDVAEDRSPPDIDFLIEACKPVMPGIGKLFNNSWWERVWVVQEVSVAKETPLVLCGEREISFDFFYDLKFCIGMAFGDRQQPESEVVQLHYDAFDEMVSIPQQWRSEPRESAEDEKERKEESEIFADLLAATSRRQSTAPQDKVFAILGMVSTNFANKNFPNYEEPIFKMYQRAMLDLLRSKEGLYYLVFATSSRKANLPSWCIDFSMRWRARDEFFLNGSSLGGDKAIGGFAQESITWDGERHAIIVQGTILGQVDLSCRLPEDSESVATKERDNPNGKSMTVESFMSLDHEEFKEEWVEILHLFCQKVGPFTTAVFDRLRDKVGLDEASKKMSEGYIWEIIGYEQDVRMAFNAEKWLKDLWENLAYVEGYMCEDVPSWQPLSEPWAHLVPAKPSELDHQVWLRVINLVSLVKNCSLFTVSDVSHYGKASGMVEKGDLLCMLFGSWYLNILRPRGDSYVLVGSAWVADVVEGQAVRDFDSLPKRSFHIV